MQRKSEMPEGWEYIPFGELISPSKEKIDPSDTPNLKYIGLEHIEAHKCRIIGHGIASDTKSTKTLFRSGDVLYGKLRPYLNKVCIPEFNGVCSTDILVFSKQSYFENRYLLHFLSTPEIVDFANNNSSGVQLPRINFQKLSQYQIPLPPLAEQHRIVAAIEALFARLDAAQARLEKVPGIVQQFRQAVLAAACDGRLTEDWRVENPLDKNSQIERHVLLKAINQDKLPKIPENWFICQIDPLLIKERSAIKTGPFGSMLKKHEHQKEGISVFGIENIRKMKFIPGSKIHISPEKAQELSNYDAKPGDILISRSGTVGEICVVPEGCGEARISSNLMRIRINKQIIRPDFFCILFNGSSYVLNQISNLCGGSTRDFINGRILRSLIFPLPPLSEQHEIVHRVDGLFALADQIEARVAAAKERTEALRQSILAQAFSGQLVPTEAELARQEGREYELASVLLERIKAKNEGEKKGTQK